jgi:hypothetical protein
MSRNFRNFPEEIHKLNKLQKPAKNNGNGRVIHNPQDSSLSSSFNSLSSKTFKIEESPVEICGNVDKRGPGFFTREHCARQVYASQEVARGMVVSLKGMGIVGEVVRCRACRLLHVVESR